MYICYGICNGPYHRGPVDVCEEDQYLWRAPIGCGIVVQEKDELVLTVADFDSTKSSPVEITLSRKGIDMPMVRLTANSYQLDGQPSLIWGRHTQ